MTVPFTQKLLEGVARATRCPRLPDEPSTAPCELYSLWYDSVTFSTAFLHARHRAKGLLRTSICFPQ